ncbi:MAG: C_GCAxxG_C_C family protein, partial [Spirochaetales bacterium]|nr:C_GCAxxG_C_C family protein [Candidatus Physcosoma equi]
RTRRERAEENFLLGYNCTQSILVAFEDLFPEEERKTIVALGSGFGGGMGRLREVCGSVSGMFFLCDYFFGYDTPETGEKKKALYEKIQTLAHRFEEKNGSIVCRELLGLQSHHDQPVPEARTPEYYKKRPCKALIGSSAEILEEFLKEEGILQ